MALKEITAEAWYDGKAGEKRCFVKAGDTFYPVDRASRLDNGVWTGKYYLWASDEIDPEGKYDITHELGQYDTIYYEDGQDEQGSPSTLPEPLDVPTVIVGQGASMFGAADALMEELKQGTTTTDPVLASVAPQLEDQVKILWWVIDQMNTAAYAARTGKLPPSALEQYIQQKSESVMRAISFPGEPNQQTLSDLGLVGWEGESGEE